MDLNGAEEVPGPGDANATGHADFTLNQGQGEICFALSWTDIDGTVSAAHIHVGPAGVAGPVVVPLPIGSSAGTAEVSACVNADPDLIKAIRQNPSDYYVNVHSLPGFVAGAVRGHSATDLRGCTSSSRCVLFGVSGERPGLTVRGSESRRLDRGGSGQRRPERLTNW